MDDSQNQQRIISQKKLDEIMAVSCILSDEHTIELPANISCLLNSNVENIENCKIENWEIKIILFKLTEKQTNIHVNLGENYPNQALASCKISSTFLPKLLVQEINQQINGLVEIAGQHGDEALYQVIEFVSDEIEKQDQQHQKQVNPPENNQDNNKIQNEHVQNNITLLVRVDHMRDQANYIKQLKKWAQDLNISGCVVIFGKIIRVVLQGTKISIKEMTKLWKTVSIDVDSKGRKCKERMIDILIEQDCQSEISGIFVFEEVSSLQGLLNILISHGIDVVEMGDLY
eukprot:TRINITY_DN14394_c0_g2_i1.p1 TRINITY_DN14394_c0_g2~~TRINITY_DN14394_c0_g2_i1.p1  ORF type:complete len:288 (-),score=23.46 TRINITY_DN14394_c0_g2_i1:64-927(-)